ncbi:MAG: DMT family transporter [Firmicutes bacterium]|nr:DMT family transporter [Bacillota bacterium]
MRKNIKFWSNLMLVGAAFIWGTQVVFQKIAATEIGPASFYGLRCVMGVFTLLVIAWIMSIRERRSEELRGEVHVKRDKNYYKRLFKVAPFCILTNVLGNTMVQAGLAYVPAAKAAFLNSIYIIFVPILSWIVYKNRTSIFTWIGTVLAVIGLYYLCMTESFTIAPGDLMILGATIFFALHIVLIAKYVKEFVGVHFSIVEFITASILCVSFGFLFEGLSLDQIIHVMPSILYCGIGGIGFCYALQVTAQRYTDPTVAALLMSLESVFAAFAGYIFLNERFTGREIIGIILIFAAIILAQLPPVKDIRAKLSSK